MKQVFYIIPLVFFINLAKAQDHLVSYYNFYSEVHGGMEDGGVSRTEAYYFKVNATITLHEIYYDDKRLVLQKGDTLVINVGLFTAYHNDYDKLDSSKQGKQEEPKELPEKDRYTIYQANRIFYANLQYPTKWNGTVTYSYKNKTYIAKAKEGFDGGNTEYAP